MIIWLAAIVLVVVDAAATVPTPELILISPTPTGESYTNDIPTLQPSTSLDLGSVSLTSMSGKLPIYAVATVESSSVVSTNITQALQLPTPAPSGKPPKSTGVMVNECCECHPNNNNNITNIHLELEEKLAEINTEFNMIINETNTQLDNLEGQLKVTERKLAHSEDQHRSANKKWLDANDELHLMHSDAIKQWVNVTLIKEDICSGIKNILSRVSRRSGLRQRYRKLSRGTLEPMMKEGKRRWNKLNREMNGYQKQKVKLVKRKMLEWWDKSTTIRPLVDSSLNYTKLEPYADDMAVSSKMTVVSAIEETSKAILRFLKKEKEDSRDEAQHQRRNSRRDNDKGKQKRQVPKRQVNAVEQPSAMNLKVRTFFEYTLANSNKLYEDGVKLLPLAIVLSWARWSIVGCILLFLGMDVSLIWTIVIVKIVFGKRRMKEAGSSDLTHTNEEFEWMTCITCDTPSLTLHRRGHHAYAFYKTNNP